MKNLIMICTLVLVGQVANAGGFVEPYIGYATNKAEGTFAASVPLVGGSAFETEAKGTVLGLRAGYKFILPWVGLDVSQFSGDGQDGASDVKTTDIGVTAGLNLPIVRPYVGYVLSSKADIGGTDYEGKATKLGLGLGFIPLIYVNIEMIDFKLDEVDGVDSETIFSDFKSKTTAFTISYVF